jgi:hypothetical protein
MLHGSLPLALGEPPEAAGCCTLFTVVELSTVRCSISIHNRMHAPRAIGIFKVVKMKLILFKKKKPKGKILRVKQGYNPNSSSMGSIVFVLPAILLVITVIFGALSGLFGSILARNIEDPDKKIGRLYIKLQNIFFKRKMKGNLK